MGVSTVSASVFDTSGKLKRSDSFEDACFSSARAVAAPSATSASISIGKARGDFIRRTFIVQLLRLPLPWRPRPSDFLNITNTRVRDVVRRTLVPVTQKHPHEQTRLAAVGAHDRDEAFPARAMPHCQAEAT